jgi:hypothetical protein
MKVTRADGRLPGGQAWLPLAQLPSLDEPLGVKIAATFESENLVDDSQRGKNIGANPADVPSRPPVAQWQRAYRAMPIVSSAFTSKTNGPN